MEYEYVALDSSGIAESREQKLRDFHCKELVTLGWKEWIRIRWYMPRDCHVRVFRRELRHDEPRMWTKEEIEKLFGEWCERQEQAAERWTKA